MEYYLFGLYSAGLFIYQHILWKKRYMENMDLDKYKYCLKCKKKVKVRDTGCRLVCSVCNEWIR